jgi:hypothetical protein
MRIRRRQLCNSTTVKASTMTIDSGHLLRVHQASSEKRPQDPSIMFALLVIASTLSGIQAAATTTNAINRASAIPQETLKLVNINVANPTSKLAGDEQTGSTTHMNMQQAESASSGANNQARPKPEMQADALTGTRLLNHQLVMHIAKQSNDWLSRQRAAMATLSRLTDRYGLPECCCNESADRARVTSDSNGIESRRGRGSVWWIGPTSEQVTEHLPSGFVYAQVDLFGHQA